MEALDYYYVYGIFYLIMSIYYPIKKWKNRQNPDEEIVVDSNTASTLTKKNKGGCIITIIDYIWLVYGACYLEDQWLFISLLILSLIPVLIIMISGTSNHFIENGFYIFSFTKCTIASFIIYNHFITLI